MRLISVIEEVLCTGGSVIEAFRYRSTGGRGWAERAQVPLPLPTTIKTCVPGGGSVPVGGVGSPVQGEGWAEIELQYCHHRCRRRNAPGSPSPSVGGSALVNTIPYHIYNTLQCNTMQHLVLPSPSVGGSA